MRLPTAHGGHQNGNGTGDVHMNGHGTRDRLPIEEVRAELVNTIRDNDTLIVMGETGSGKSTKLPQFVRDARLFESAIAVTQPRRIAAISISKRVADERSVEVGKEVGFSVRFDEKSSHETKLKYLTDGMLLREAQSDPSLKRYGCIILDEAHERTIHTDVLFGIIKNAQRRRMLKAGEQKLKVIVMSATMDVDHFSKYFNCKVVYLEGRPFPINVRYSTNEVDDYIGAAISTVLSLHSNVPPEEHFLVFLTGQDEIEAASKILREQHSRLAIGSSSRPKMEILSLYSAVPQKQQLNVFKPAKPGTRRVIISTNIAETSLTIPNVHHVIDSGRVKQKRYNPSSGMQLLKVCWCSKAQVWQRAGRAGRVSSGHVYRLFTNAQYEQMLDSTIPEIQRSPLANVCLQLLNANVKNLHSFEFIDPPPPDALRKAIEELRLLGMVSRTVNTEQSSGSFELTPIGKKAARFPLEPRLAKALLIAAELRCSEECIIIASLLSAESIFLYPAGKREEAKEAHRKFHSADGDFITMLNTYKAFLKAQKDKTWMFQNYLCNRNLENVTKIRKQLREIFSSLSLPLATCPDKPETIRQAFARGMFMNCAELKPDGLYQELGQSLSLKIHPSSVLFGSKPPFIMFNELVETNALYARNVFVAEPSWVLEAGRDWFKTRKITNRE